jgi:hypothetical protein
LFAGNLEHTLYEIVLAICLTGTATVGDFIIIEGYFLILLLFSMLFTHSVYTEKKTGQMLISSVLAKIY